MLPSVHARGGEELYTFTHWSRRRKTKRTGGVWGTSTTHLGVRLLRRGAQETSREAARDSRTGGGGNADQQRTLPRSSADAVKTTTRFQEGNQP